MRFSFIVPRRQPKPLTLLGVPPMMPPVRISISLTLMLCSLLALPSSAFALRGSRVESAAVTAPGRVAVEFGHQALTNAQGSRTQQQRFTMSSGINNQQLDVILPWQIEQEQAGEDLLFGDVTLLHKIGAMAAWGDGRTLLGTFTKTTFPTSKVSRAGSNNYRVETHLLLSRTNGQSIVSLNAGAVVQTAGKELMRWGVGAEHVWKRLGIYGEVIGFTDFLDNGANELISGAGGIEVLLADSFSIDVGSEVGFSGNANDWGVSGGATLTF